MWTAGGPGSENARRGRGFRLAAVLCAGLFLAGATASRALSTDRDQPIAIEADQAERDGLKGVMTYRVDVVIDQGSLHIAGDTVIAHFDGENDISKMIAIGTPAHFRQLPDGDAHVHKAWANRIEYFPGQDLIVLLGDARYERGGSRMQADRLVYDSLNARLKALTETADPPAGSDDGEAGGKKPGRVRIRIEPGKTGTR